MKLVAADYRLKRLALAHDPSPVPEVVNYLDLQARRLTTGPQKQHRWWFIAKYDALHHSPDNTAFEFEGAGVAVETAPTIVGGQPAGAGAGKKVSGKKGAEKKPTEKKPAEKAPEASISARQFAVSATKHFPTLAQQIPVFAELQNIVALTAAAELIAEQTDAPGEVAAVDAIAAARGLWEPTHFLDAKACPTAVVSAPTQVASLSNYRLVDNRHWLISISGGVEISLADVVSDEVRKESPKRRLAETRERHRSGADTTRWWWD
jgi:hypothetical protein